MSKLKDARDHIYKLEFRIADLTVEVDRLRIANTDYAKQAVELKAENKELTAIIDRVPQTIYENICDELGIYLESTE